MKCIKYWNQFVIKLLANKKLNNRWFVIFIYNMFKCSLLNEFYDAKTDKKLKIAKPILKDLDHFNDANINDLVSVRRSKNKITLLQYVCNTPQLPYIYELIEFLVNKGLDINKLDTNGIGIVEHCFNLCVSSEEILNMVNLVINLPQYVVNVESLTRAMTLMTNVDVVNVELYNLLLSKGGKVTPDHLIDMIPSIKLNTNKESILNYIKILMNDLKISINHLTSEKNTIIVSLLYHSDLYYFIKELINDANNKFDVKILDKCNIFGRIIQMYHPNNLAILDLINFLIDKGLKYDIVDSYGNRTLSYVKYYPELYELLVNRGCRINDTDIATLILQSYHNNEKFEYYLSIFKKLKITNPKKSLDGVFWMCVGDQIIKCAPTTVQKYMIGKIIDALFEIGYKYGQPYVIEVKGVKMTYDVKEYCTKNNITVSHFTQ